jgi:hypothetical protein
MVNRVEIFIIGKDDGALLYHYDLLGQTDPKDEIVSGFLTAINNFAREMGWANGVSMIRSGSLEARFSAGKYIFAVFIIDYQMPLGYMTEPILSGLIDDVSHKFEEVFAEKLEKASKTHIYAAEDYEKFQNEVDKIIDQYGAESFELYQKMVLIEAIDHKVPQKVCLPLMELIGAGQPVTDEFDAIIKKYPQMKKAINKVNRQGVVWEIFAVPIFPVY